jgi:integral membrane protein (TIGR01906 family)
MQVTLRILFIISRWLFILCLPAVLLTASIGIAINCQPLYEYGFDKYEVGQTTGLEDVELQKATSELISYFNSSKETIDITVIKDGQPFILFNEREVTHLRDVKKLIQLDYLVLLASGCYVLLYAVVSLCWLTLESQRQLAKAVIYGSASSLGVMLLLGLMALIDFDWFFLQFHLISFANDMWQLDPVKDYLIMLFPQGFWFDATIFCALLTLGLALLLGGAASGYLFVRREVESRLDLWR